MADDDPNKKEEGMSQGVATKYRALFEELRFAKQQQWMATNYLLLVLAAIFGIGTAIKPLTDCEKCIAMFLLVVAVIGGCAVLIDLQLSLGRTRKLLNRIEGKETKFFSQEERQVLKFEEYEHPFGRGVPILVILMGAAIFGAVLVGYAILFRL